MRLEPLPKLQPVHPQKLVTGDPNICSTPDILAIFFYNNVVNTTDYKDQQYPQQLEILYALHHEIAFSWKFIDFHLERFKKINNK